MVGKQPKAGLRIPLFKVGDINGLVYVFTGNIGSFLLVIATLKGFGWSDDLVFRKVIPGICMGLFFSGMYYTYMALKLAKKENRSDVTALPYGLSTPVTIVYLFSVILPLQYGLKLTPEETWRAAVAAVFLGGVIEASGGIIGPFIRKVVPRAAMLATVGGISLLWMGTKGLFNVYHLPLIGMPVLVIAILGLIGGYKLPKKIPPLAVALIFGIIVSLVTGEGRIVLDGLGRFTPPIPAVGAIIGGFKLIVPVLVAIIPVEIYNFIDTMNNVESAIASGDTYNVREAQMADGCATSIGALFGAVMPNTVWIGHPGLKSAGCGIGFAWVSAVLFGISGWFGVFNFLYYLVPFVVVAIVFLWCTQIILGQAFVDTPRRYAPAIVIGLVPHIADLLFTQTSAIFTSMGLELSMASMAKAMDGGAMWFGVEALKNGAIITGMIWAAVVCFVIDRNLLKAAGACALGGILTFFGVIHTGHLGLNFGAHGLIFGYFLAALVVLIFHFSRKKLEFECRYDCI